MSRDWRELCHCGHHKDSHYEARHNCLGMHCDCERYVDVNDPLPKKSPSKDIDLDDHRVITPLVPHPSWCTCDDCLASCGVP